MDVYIVIAHHYDGEYILGAYSSLELARKRADKREHGSGCDYCICRAGLDSESKPSYELYIKEAPYVAPEEPKATPEEISRFNGVVAEFRERWGEPRIASVGRNSEA